MESDRYEVCKTEIRSILLTFKDFTSIDEFLKAYQEIIGERLPSRTFGYSSDIDFLKSMPDVVHVSISEIGKIVLSGIADESTKHIQKLVSRQKSSKRTGASKYPKSKPFHTPVNVKEFRHFVPGPLKAEILELASFFPDGVSLPNFVIAYHKKYKKYLPLEKGLLTLEHMINYSIEDLCIKSAKYGKMIYWKNKPEDTLLYIPQAKGIMESDRYEVCKTEIRSILLTFKDFTSIDEFLKAYQEIIGERLPSRTFGYSSDIDFLKSMPDVVHVSISEIGKIVLSGIADESTKHIQKLVSMQKSSKRTSASKYLKSKPFNMPVNVKEFRPFVPGPLKAEILELASFFPDGVSLTDFVIAYHKKYKKYLPLERGFLTLEHMINYSIEDLCIKTAQCGKMIYWKNKSEDTLSFTPQVKDSGYRENIEPNAEKFHKSGISVEIQKNFQQVLQKYPQGILAVNFPALYEHVTSQLFDLHRFGYNSILTLVDALPHIFKRILDDPCDNKTWRFFPANSTVKSENRSVRRKQITKDSYVSNQKESPPSPLKLRKGVPADIASPYLHYEPPKIPKNINLAEYIPIFVSSIITPSLFWFQLQTDKIAKSFEAFENDLGSFYSSHAASRYKMNDSSVVIGAICVVQCPDDKLWYRAVIKSIPSAESVKVFFVDYGSGDEIPRANLRYVRNKYLNYPAAAFRAELADLKPAKNSVTWDIKAIEKFIQLSGRSSLMAYFKPAFNLPESDTFSIYLCDTSEKNDIHINDFLVYEGLAELKNHSSEHVVSSILNQTEQGTTKNLSSKFCVLSTTSSINTPCYESTEHEDCVVIPEKRHSFSADKQPSLSEISHAQKQQSCKRYVKQLKCCQDTKIHIINLNEKLYISAGDLSHLFWNDFLYVVERVKFKGVTVPFVDVAKEENSNLFHQCKLCQIYDFKNSESEISSLTLCTLEWAIKILNLLGHHSLCLRLAIQNEITNFNPEDKIWKEFCYEEPYAFDDTFYLTKKKLEKLSLFDLEIKYNELELKRVSLLKKDATSASDEIKDIEHLQDFIKKRMKYIEDICFQYSTHS